MLTRPIRLLTLVVLALALAPPSVPAAEKILHLAIGDPARKDRVAPLVLDGITDTKTGELITPQQLAERLATTRLLLIGEEHTNREFHNVQFRVLDALIKSGRRVLIGLEMYPYTEQPFLDQWNGGQVTEDGFLRVSRWYENWGYNWLYYRDIFMLARDHKVLVFGVNTPREVVSAVRMKGIAGLPPELAAHIPKDIDVDNADHATFFRTTFEGNEGPVHGMSVPDEMFKNMLSAQCTWDASMGYYGVQALKKVGDPKAIMVILVGSGHVAYGLGIERQAKKWVDGPIATIIPVPVGTAARGIEKDTQASYANFTWGVADEPDTAYPMMGTSTAVGQGDAARRVIIVQPGSPAASAGVKVGDILQALDGVPLTEKETFNRVMATKRWGDAAPLVVKRGDDTLTLTVVFRRQLHEK
jgi:uncharacterized iron-regulated protein